jgi:hypothetical protein
MATGALTGTTMTAEDIFEKLTTTGVSKTEAQVVVANWILGNAGVLPRTFSFRTPFAASEASCAPQFTRSFAHEDWVDGEDVVQAEQTTVEEGFNLRFHRIESDLDALGQDVAQAFTCLNSMRASLRLLLDELQSEVNSIHMQIARHGRDGRVLVDAAPSVGGKYLGATKYFDADVHVFETAAGKVMLPAIEGIKVTPFENPRVQRTQAFGEFILSDRVKEFFRQGGVPKAAFLEKFGEVTLANGESVRDATDIVPAETRFETPQAMLVALTTREGAAIRTSGLEQESIAVTFGLTGTDRVADAPLDRLEVVPRNARSVLAREGISTVGAFAGADATKLAALLQERGVDASATDVSGWVGASLALLSAR